MGVDIIQSHRPIWVCKLNKDKLKQYLDALNEFELKETTDNELLLDTAETWYNSSIQHLAMIFTKRLLLDGMKLIIKSKFLGKKGEYNNGKNYRYVWSSS